MAHKMRLDLQVTGIARYHKAAEAVERLARAQRNLQSAGGSGGGSVGGGGSIVPSGNNTPVSAGSRGPKAPPRLPAPMGGPNSRLQRAVQNLHLAKMSGDPSAIADAQYHLQNAQKAMSRGQGQSFSQRLNSFVRSTRVGSGVSPLVGQGLDLLGLGKFAGPAGLAAAALTALVKATMAVKEKFLEFGADSAVGGGTPGQTVAARVLSNATGVDLFKLSRQFQTSYFEGGVQSQHLRRYGYQSGYGLNRNTNSIAPALKSLKRMVEAGDLRALQDFGAEGLYGLRNLTKQERDRYFDSIGSAMSPDKVAAALRFNLAMEDLKQTFFEAGTALTPLIEGASKLIRFFSGFDANGKPVHYGISDGAWNANERSKSPAERNIDATNRNTDAMNDLSASVDSLTQQFKGGGPRGRGAIPEGWRDRTLEQLTKEQLAMGAFV